MEVPIHMRAGPKTVSLALWLGLLGGIGGCGGGGSKPTFVVTASASTGGSIQPASAEVVQGATTSFTITPEDGYLVAAVTGCGGTLSGDRYTTGPVTAACTVAASFRLPSVSGLVSPAGGTAIDSDVNDPLAPHQSNDPPDGAQAIPNPVTLGGYVNVAGAGFEGRSSAAGDAFDVFQLSLLGGQAIVLQIASEDVTDDLDLHLRELDGTLVDASTDPAARTESLFVPAGQSGEYRIEVEAWSGASNYLLTIAPAAPAAQRSMRLSDAFVPGEAIVLLHELSPSEGIGLAAQAATSGWASRRTSESAPRNVLLDLSVLEPADLQQGLAKGDPRNPRSVPDRLDRLGPMDRGLREKLETLYMIKTLYQDPSTVHAMPNYLYRLAATFEPDDPHFALQWHYPQIALPSAWTQGTGAGSVVAVIDSGVWLQHPDLQGQLVGGHDFVLGISGGNDPGDNPRPPSGSGYHGTHVAGTVVAATNNARGVAGVAFDSRVMPLRACSSDGCTSYSVEQSLRFAAGLPNDSGQVPAETAGVINLSLGRTGPAVPAEEAFFQELRSRDILVVAAAGNDASSVPHYPASYPQVISVSAVDIQGRQAWYSSFGSAVGVAAPGGDTRSDLNGDGHPDGVLSTSVNDLNSPPTPVYRFYQGTSMATPHVAGVLALMRAAAPGLSAADIENLLLNGLITDDLGAPGWDTIYGHGLINAAKAVSEALASAGNPVPLDPRLAASPTLLNFGVSLESLTLTLSNTGGGELTFGTPGEDSGGWLSLESAIQDDRMIVTARVDRTGLAEGTFQATATFPSSANTITVEVLMQVADVPGSAVGLQYLILADPETFDTIGFAVGEPQGVGSYAYRVDDMPAGTYLLVSGSDANNDGFICDAGESCGIYRTLGDPVLIEVDGADLAGLDFNSGYFLQSLSSQFEGSNPFRGFELCVAEREGFEPSRGVSPCRFSRPVRSTAPPPLRKAKDPGGP